MSKLTFNTPTLYADHVPDHSRELDSNGVARLDELPGFVHFGIILNGVKIPLGKKGTAGILADIKRAQAKQDAEQAATPTEPDTPQG